VSNPAQNHWPCPVIVQFAEISAISGKLREGEIEMEPYRPSIRRRLASVWEFLGRLVAIFQPQAQEVRLQRMCPFCGLITPRAKRSCLECGKSLSPVPLERVEAKQG